MTDKDEKALRREKFNRKKRKKVSNGPGFVPKRTNKPTRRERERFSNTSGYDYTDQDDE